MDNNMDNITQQKDEIQALSAIYGESWKAESTTGKVYCMQVTNDVKLFIYLNEYYPTDAPPIYNLQAPYLTKLEKQSIDRAFDVVYLDNIGVPMLYQWIEKLRSMVTRSERVVETDAPKKKTEKAAIKKTNVNFFHGNAIKDRKSVFQGHVCEITSQQQVKYARESLLETKKIAQAKHNIVAYRVAKKDGSILQDHDDDGESQAGSRLLHLLEAMNVVNVMVVVTRWYGGVHLGPDRFRHINNAARGAMQRSGFIK